MNALKVYSFYKKEVSLTHNSGVVESYFYPKQDYFTDVNSRPASPPCALTGWLARSTTFFRVNSQSSEQSSSTRRWGTPASTSRNARKCRLPGQKALYWRAQSRGAWDGRGELWRALRHGLSSNKQLTLSLGWVQRREIPASLQFTIS